MKTDTPVAPRRRRGGVSQQGGIGMEIAPFRKARAAGKESGISFGHFNLGGLQMALFYDRDYGHDWNRGYDRGYGGYRGRSGWNEPDRNFDRGQRMSGSRYDRGFKSRWQTDYGDTFNDRGSRTPTRMTR